MKIQEFQNDVEKYRKAESRQIIKELLLDLYQAPINLSPESTGMHLSLS